jgi:hypothetical protein
MTGSSFGKVKQEFESSPEELGGACKCNAADIGGTNCRDVQPQLALFGSTQFMVSDNISKRTSSRISTPFV